MANASPVGRERVDGERRREAICPSWCAGHGDRFQAWEVLVTGGPERDHSDEPGVDVAGVAVTVSQVEGIDHQLGPARVTVWAGLDEAALSPGQAREVAGALLAAADRAEGGR